MAAVTLASSRSRRARCPADRDRVDAPLAGRDRCRAALAPDKRGDPLGVERGRHDQEAEAGAQLAASVERQSEPEVGLQVALVQLVEHHQSGAGQGRVALEAAGEDALGHHFDPGAVRRPALVAGDIAHRAADLVAEQRGHPPGGGAGGQTPWLQHDDSLSGQPPLVEQPEGHDRRLARAWRRHEDGVPG